jgi:hypothetical protein
VSSAKPRDIHGVDTANNAYRNAGHKTCLECGNGFHSYNKTRKYCGLKCSAMAARVRREIACVECGSLFLPNVDARKYCSVSCAKKARPRVCGYVKRPRAVHSIACENCGKICVVSPSQHRKYCSYKCHLDSGGARRAGDAAAMAKLKYGPKKDANHTEIFQAIEVFTAVKDLSNAGCGIPDGIAWVNNGWHLFDVKNPKTGYGKRGLNSRQKQWADDWRGGPVFLIYTVEEAMRFARGNFDGIKKFPDAELIPIIGTIS